MKSLAIDLDSGKLSRWVDDPRPFAGWTDKYGDLYTIRVTLYRSGGGRVGNTSLKFLVKKPQRRDVQAIWTLSNFSRVPSLTSLGIVVYEGQVSVDSTSYRTALRLDASPGNDLPSAEFTGVIRTSTSDNIGEVEFKYTVLNNAYRLADVSFTGVYVGISETNGLLVRNVDGPEWRELVVMGEGNNAAFSLGDAVLGPVSEISSLSDDYVRLNNGVLQIKNEDTGNWVNVLLRGQGGVTISLGEDPPVGFTLSSDRYKVDLTTGRLLLRNLTTGNWHEARVQLSDSTNTLALGTEYDDSEI
jgi:hypothetical protein